MTQARLAASDREIQEAMQQLQDDRVMRLEEGGVVQASSGRQLGGGLWCHTR
jgi:hypothetical protein